MSANCSDIVIPPPYTYVNSKGKNLRNRKGKICAAAVKKKCAAAKKAVAHHKTILIRYSVTIPYYTSLAPQLGQKLAPVVGDPQLGQKFGTAPPSAAGAAP